METTALNENVLTKQGRKSPSKEPEKPGSIWRALYNYEDYYEVSNHGQVKTKGQKSRVFSIADLINLTWSDNIDKKIFFDSIVTSAKNVRDMSNTPFAFEIDNKNWKIIENFPNYAISSSGEVKNKYGKLITLRNGGFELTNKEGIKIFIKQRILIFEHFHNQNNSSDNILTQNSSEELTNLNELKELINPTPTGEEYVSFNALTSLLSELEEERNVLINSLGENNPYVFIYNKFIDKINNL